MSTDLVRYEKDPVFANLPDTFKQNAIAAFGGVFDMFGGSEFRRVSLKGNRFTLVDSAVKTTLETNHLDMVIMGFANEQHCLYNAGKYTGEDTPPDAIWLKSQPFPDMVPMAAREKSEDANKGYRVRLRMVLCRVITLPDNRVGADVETPYVLDINEMSMYGEDLVTEKGTAYGIASLIRWMRTHRITPCQLGIRAVFDSRQSVPALRFLPVKQGDALFQFDEDIQAYINAHVNSPAITNLLTINVGKLGEDGKYVPFDTPTAQAAPMQETQAAPSRAAAARAKRAEAPTAAPAQPAASPSEDGFGTPAPAPVQVTEPPVVSTSPVKDISNKLDELLDGAGSFGS